MKERILQVCRLGRIDYDAALNIQKEFEANAIAGKENDTILLLEHPHTYTLGRRSREDGVFASAKLLEALGAKVFETNRGGKITYHGIGQLVGYPILNLSPDREDVHRYVRDLEEVIIRSLREFAIESFRIEGLTGVHTREGKIAAIGVHIKRWVTTHGFALNVNTDLTFFQHIIACEGEPVTSMQKLTGSEFTLSEVEDVILKNFAEVFDFQEMRNRNLTTVGAIQ